MPVYASSGNGVLSSWRGSAAKALERKYAALAEAKRRLSELGAAVPGVAEDAICVRSDPTDANNTVPSASRSHAR
jgi:hypothetical protein